MLQSDYRGIFLVLAVYEKTHELDTKALSDVVIQNELKKAKDKNFKLETFLIKLKNFKFFNKRKTAFIIRNSLISKLKLLKINFSIILKSK